MYPCCILAVPHGISVLLPPKLASALTQPHRVAAKAGSRRKSSQHYYDMVEPAAALEALEVELDRLIMERCGLDDSAEGEEIACRAVCTLIKQECDAEVRPLPPGRHSYVSNSVRNGQVLATPEPQQAARRLAT